MALDRVSRSLLMSELLSGLWLPLKCMFRTKATINCPHETMYLSNWDCWDALLVKRLELALPYR